ncbi:hypothetical protein L1049_017387 [Liquidambar formosana]|uniref:Uncharacterized protein n=1 Tax=Liquidambar formosana TaxID=63359 RepID=A0AAP0S7W3_LIQFO
MEVYCNEIGIATIFVVAITYYHGGFCNGSQRHAAFHGPRPSHTFPSSSKTDSEKNGFTITIANTPLNIQYLRNTISTTSEPSNIRLAELPFSSSDHGLTPNTENTEIFASSSKS